MYPLLAHLILADNQTLAVRFVFKPNIQQFFLRCRTVHNNPLVVDILVQRIVEKALVLDNKNPLSFYLTAKAAIGMKDDITAIAMLTKAIVLKEDYTEAYQLRAEVLWKMKQAKDAAEDIQKLLSLNPDDEQALLLKGEILAATNDHSEKSDLLFILDNSSKVALGAAIVASRLRENNLRIVLCLVHD